jgi:hypothetical protein
VRSKRKKLPAGITPLSNIEGVPSAAFRVHPVRSTALAVLLYSSIHSSLYDVVVPIQAISLTTTSRCKACGVTGAARTGRAATTRTSRPKPNTNTAAM